MKLRHLFIASLLLLSFSAHAFDLNVFKHKAVSPPSSSRTGNPTGLVGISKKDQIESLKQALTQCAETAVTDIGHENGFLKNDKVRIPLPDSLQKIEKLMRSAGMDNYADELITSMNRAAERAVPLAKSLLTDAVKRMSVSDAKAILLGGEDAGTQYFRQKTESALTAKFKPIISSSMQGVGLAEKYNQFAGQGVRLGVMKQEDAHLDDYITRRALDGLFLTMAEQESLIRAHPMQAAGALVQKVFAAIIN
jgi:hypothetical protein